MYDQYNYLSCDQYNHLFQALEELEKFYDAHVFACSAPIDNDSYTQLITAIEDKKSLGYRQNALLILTTSGGLANSAYNIARLFQNEYRKFTVYCPSFCKSAGTLITLGAHCLIMDNFSELGPLDVQLYNRDEIDARKSGLLTRSAFESLSQEVFALFSKTMLGIKGASGNLVSFKLASDISSRLTAELMSPIFGQLNPDIIGSDFRDLSVGSEYGARLAKHSNNPQEETVSRLVENYPSHDFIIDKDEARSLFKNIEEPSDELYRFVEYIAPLVYSQAEPKFITPFIAPKIHTEDMKTDKKRHFRCSNGRNTKYEQTASVTARTAQGGKKMAGTKKNEKTPAKFKTEKLTHEVNVRANRH